MQVFIIGSVIDTALSLDKKRFNKQIVEVGQIINALRGETKAWRNHPCTLQYRHHEEWLRLYRTSFEYLNMGKYKMAAHISNIAERFKPEFHTEEYFNQMKRRLYTKDKEYYLQWKHLGESYENWYWSYRENCFIKYEKGRRIQ